MRALAVPLLAAAMMWHGAAALPALPVSSLATLSADRADTAKGACCFLSMQPGSTCANHVAAVCPSVAGCETEAACVGLCSTISKGTWCPNAPAPAPPAGTGCSGPPTSTIQWFANGACNAASGSDTGWCGRLPGRPSVCWYKWRIVGTQISSDGWWSAAGCNGPPQIPGGILPMALNQCIQKGNSATELVLNGPEHVMQEVWGVIGPPPPPPSPADCSGTPMMSEEFVADGHCNQLRGQVCTSVPGSAGVCSYQMSVTATLVTLQGFWASGTGCTGPPQTPGGSVPLGACFPIPQQQGISFKYVLTAPQRVSQEIFMGGIGPKPGTARHDTGNVPQVFRPPRLTAMQSTAIGRISERAAALSPKAQNWVLQYLGSSAVRTRLDPSLQHLTTAELMDRFAWEFPRLPLLHNAPIDNADAERLVFMPALDDTILNLTLSNGFLQTPGQRVVDGASGETTTMGIGYHQMATAEWGFPPHPNPAEETTADANDGLLFCANNLRKTSGNPMAFGSETHLDFLSSVHLRPPRVPPVTLPAVRRPTLSSVRLFRPTRDFVAIAGMTYVLNTRSLKGRLFVETADGGLIEMMNNPLHFAPGPARYDGQ